MTARGESQIWHLQLLRRLRQRIAELLPSWLWCRAAPVRLLLRMPLPVLCCPRSSCCAACVCTAALFVVASLQAALRLWVDFPFSPDKVGWGLVWNYLQRCAPRLRGCRAAS
jgi:hypothetical protein